MSATEYRVCVDCYWYCETGEFGDGCPESIKAAVLAGFGAVDETGWPSGSAENIDEFSKQDCEICGSDRAGVRYGIIYF